MLPHLPLLPHALAITLIATLGALGYALYRLRVCTAQPHERAGGDTRAADLPRQDPLTGLPHRHDFMTRLTTLLQTPGGRNAAVFIFDLACFRSIAQHQGPALADRLLIEFAARVTALIGESDVLAYFGEDDFALALADSPSLDRVTRLAHQIVVTAERPFTLGVHTLHVGANIGIAIAPDDGDSADELVRRATIALHRTRNPFTSTVHFFETAMDTAIDAHARIRESLPHAIRRGAIQVYFQPIMAADDRRIVAFEALARWNAPGLGAIAPDVFIQIAADHGLLRELNESLFRQACRHARGWPASIRLCFNLAAGQFVDRALGLHLVGILGQEDLAPSRVDFEIDSLAFLGDGRAALTLVNELRMAGACITLGGHGRRGASLADLITIPFDRLHIGRDIVHALGQDTPAAAMVRLLADYAHARNAQVTAQGIETREQFRLVTASGCDTVQGYYLCRPVPAEHIPTLLNVRPGKPRRPRLTSKSA